jgi:hypothetical protein
VTAVDGPQPAPGVLLADGGTFPGRHGQGVCSPTPAAKSRKIKFEVAHPVRAGTDVIDVRPRARGNTTT